MDQCQKVGKKRLALPAELICELCKAIPLAKCRKFKGKLRKKSNKVNGKETLLKSELDKRTKILRILKKNFRKKCKSFVRHERRLARFSFNCRLFGGYEDLPGAKQKTKNLCTKKYYNCKEIVGMAGPLKDDDASLASNGNGGKRFGEEEAKMLAEAVKYIEEFEQSDYAKEL